jgi:hypothetical protein
MRVISEKGVYMTELDKVIAAAFASEGKQDDVNKVYLTLLRTPVFLPVQKEPVVQDDNEEPFKPLFAIVDDQYFMLIFDTVERLTAWAGEQIDNINYVEISGRDVVAGINDQVFLCLNHGTDFYKEFTPDEVKRLKMIVSRIDQLKSNG